MKIGIGIGVEFGNVISAISGFFTWGKSTPTKVWGTATTETWG